jgi:hypothetical protein
VKNDYGTEQEAWDLNGAEELLKTKIRSASGLTVYIMKIVINMSMFPIQDTNKYQNGMSPIT